MAQKVSDPRFSHFVAPPLPVINDQSLTEGNALHVITFFNCFFSISTWYVCTALLLHRSHVDKTIGFVAFLSPVYCISCSLYCSPPKCLILSLTCKNALFMVSLFPGRFRIGGSEKDDRCTRDKPAQIQAFLLFRH